MLVYATDIWNLIKFKSQLSFNIIFFLYREGKKWYQTQQKYRVMFSYIEYMTCVL